MLSYYVFDFLSRNVNDNDTKTNERARTLEKAAPMCETKGMVNLEKEVGVEKRYFFEKKISLTRQTMNSSASFTILK